MAKKATMQPGETTPKKQLPAALAANVWQPGQSGNPAGRPKSSRNKLTEDFLKALADDFDQHGKAAIVEVRQEDPAKYLSIVAQLVPKETDVNVKGDEAFVRIWQAVASGTMAAIVDQLEDEARH
jgi:hypothetical protein